MSREQKGKVVIGCSIVAAVCFGIVSYGHFYRGRMELGWVFAILTAAQLGLAVMNYRLQRKIAEADFEGKESK
ncbi:MAG: hypothetical protein ACI4WY_00890 [Anaerovoracaceae bacterium]